jgi:hypothetical protein
LVVFRKGGGRSEHDIEVGGGHGQECKRLHTQRTFNLAQVELNEKAQSADVRAFCKAL